VDPNGQNQTWSQWTFSIRECGRHASYREIELNVARWLRMGFGSVGKVRVRQTILGWIIETIVEGVPVQDPSYTTHVAQQFQRCFVEPGLGMFATSKVTSRLIAGSPQDGRPRMQWVEMPTIRLLEEVERE
jgi:hypothetical protein